MFDEEGLGGPFRQNQPHQFGGGAAGRVSTGSAGGVSRFCGETRRLKKFESVKASLICQRHEPVWNGPRTESLDAADVMLSL